MTDIQIGHEVLTIAEMAALADAIAQAEHIVYIRPDYWQKIKTYVLREQGDFVGACAVVALPNNWVKIGPLVLVQKYHGQGYGKKLLSRVIQMHEGQHLFIHSSHPAVLSIIQPFAFVEVSSVYQLPQEVKVHAFKHIIDNAHLELLRSYLKKRVGKKHRGRSFVKKKK